MLSAHWSQIPRGEERRLVPWHRRRLDQHEVFPVSAGRFDGPLRGSARNVPRSGRRRVPRRREGIQSFVRPAPRRSGAEGPGEAAPVARGPRRGERAGDRGHRAERPSARAAHRGDVRERLPLPRQGHHGHASGGPHDLRDGRGERQSHPPRGVGRRGPPHRQGLRHERRLRGGHGVVHRPAGAPDEAAGGAGRRNGRPRRERGEDRRPMLACSPRAT